MTIVPDRFEASQPAPRGGHPSTVPRVDFVEGFRDETKPNGAAIDVSECASRRGYDVFQLAGGKICARSPLIVANSIDPTSGSWSGI